MFKDHAGRHRPAPPPSWRGVRLHRCEIGIDPDALPEPVILPVDWPMQAASGLVALRRTPALIGVPEAASAWIDPIAARARAAGLDDKAAETLVVHLHDLVRDRRAAPSAGIWRGIEEAIPGFLFNLAEFSDDSGQFDAAELGNAVETAVLALSLAAPGAQRLALGMTDLSLLLARLNHDYGSEDARSVAVHLAALIAAHADIASARLLARGMAPGTPIASAALSRTCVIPGLHDHVVAMQKRAAELGLRQHRSLTGILPPGAVDMLLGVETIGIAAPLSPLASDGKLARWARARIAAAGRSAEDALAGVIAGGDPFAVADRASLVAMRDAVAPFIAILPEMQESLATRASGVGAPREKLPSRRGGYTQKSSIAGHRLFLRTGEYPDGRLGEISLSLPKESATVRAMAEAFATAVSVGLQHGTPLDEFVDAFAFVRFGAAGAVEGDPAMTQASSVLDYAFRHLAANYLGRHDLAAATPTEEDTPPPAPQLPLDLPHAEGNRRGRGRPILKLVS